MTSQTFLCRTHLVPSLCQISRSFEDKQRSYDWGRGGGGGARLKVPKKSMLNRAKQSCLQTKQFVVFQNTLCFRICLQPDLTARNEALYLVHFALKRQFPTKRKCYFEQYERVTLKNSLLRNDSGDTNL